MTQHFVLHITSPKLARLAIAINPDLKDKHYDTELENHYMILCFPKLGQYTLVNPMVFERSFDQVPDDEVFIFNLYQRIVREEPDPLRKTPFIRNS